MFNLAGTTMKLWSFTAVILVEILVYPSCGNSQIHGSSAPFSNPNYGVLTGLSILGPRYENVDMLRRYENFLSGYDTTDFTGNRRWRNERRTPNGRVIGNYGILDRNGQVHIVDYITDENGYRAVERERDLIPQSNQPNIGDTYFLPLPSDPHLQGSRPFPDPPLHSGLIPYEGINFHPDVDITQGNVDIYPKPGPYPQIPLLQQNTELFQPTGVHQLHNPFFPPTDDLNLKAIGLRRSLNSTLFSPVGGSIIQNIGHSRSLSAPYVLPIGGGLLETIGYFRTNDVPQKPNSRHIPQNIGHIDPNDVPLFGETTQPRTLPVLGHFPISRRINSPRNQYPENSGLSRDRQSYYPADRANYNLIYDRVYQSPLAYLYPYQIWLT